MAIDQLECYINAKKTAEKAWVARLFLAYLVIFVIVNIFLGIWNSLTYYAFRFR